MAVTGLAAAAIACMCAGEAARAERPLTYREALAAAARDNPLAERAELAADRAGAMVVAARGGFDPLLLGTALRSAMSFEEVRDALPISGDDHGWDLGVQVTGLAPTGTGYMLSVGAGFDRSYATGLQPVYDDQGEQIGTAPYEANRAAYGAFVGLTLSQQLLRGVQLAYNLQYVRAAAESRTGAELAALAARQQAMADAATAYWNWVYQVRVHEIDLDVVAVAEEAVRVAEEQVEARVLAPLDRARIEDALVLARADALASGVLAAQARDLLLLTMGETPGQDVVPATDPGTPPAIEIDPAAAIEVALAQSPELAAARSAARVGSLTEAAARHGRLPALTATVTAGRMTGDQATLGAAVGGLSGEAGQPSLSVGAIFQLPIGNRAAIGTARAARADRLAAESLVREIEDRIRAEVADHVTRLAAAREGVALADRSLALAEEALGAVEALVAANRAIPRDVLEARAIVERARVEAVRARIDWRLASTGLLRLQASLTEELP